MNAAEGEGVVDEAFFGTATSSIFEDRATKSRVTSDTSVIVENKIFCFITGTFTSVFIENSTDFTLTDIIKEKSEERILNVTSDTFTKTGCNISSFTLALVAISVEDKEVIGVTYTFFRSSIKFNSANTKVASVILGREVVGHTGTGQSCWSEGQVCIFSTDAVTIIVERRSNTGTSDASIVMKHISFFTNAFIIVI